MQSVLVTRPQPAADEFAGRLRQAGYKAYVAPMMEYIPLAADVSGLAACQALVFTSAQGVHAFARLSPERTLPALAVGEATAAAAREAGFTAVHAAAGSGATLSGMIADKAEALGLRKVFHACGEDTSDPLSASRAGVEIVRCPVYKAKFLDAVPADVLTALRRGAVDIVTVFSERTAENLVRLFLREKLQGSCARLEAVCVSERIAATLKQLPWRSIHISPSAHAEAVMSALAHASAVDLVQQGIDRRRNADRRQKTPQRDAQGLIQAEAYSGPDRRRLHKRRQQERVMRERLQFANRIALTMAFMFIAVVGAGVFLLAPEYARLQHKSDQKRPVVEKEQGETAEAGSLSGKVNLFIGKMEDLLSAFFPSSSAPAGRHAEPMSLSGLFDNIMALRASAEGEKAVLIALDKLRAVAAASHAPETLGHALQSERQKDKAIEALLGPVKKEDLAAGAMLLLLNEFRGNVSKSRPYAQDIALLQKIAGDDPEMQRALQRLTPYAKTGVMSRQALQAEMQGLAGDIIAAKMQGQDLSVQEAAQRRLEALSRAARAEDVQGMDEAAVVARARILLDQGDVDGALIELHALKGAPAEKARPWMENAAGHAIAEQSSDVLVAGALRSIAGGSSLSVSGMAELIRKTLRGPEVPYLSPALKKGPDGGAGVVAPASTAP